jgi:chromate reductase
VQVLLISGSLRDESSNSATLRTVASLAPAGVTAVVYPGLGFLPHFNPDLDGELVPAEVDELRAEIHAADAVLFCIPEYASALPGSFKNLLEWCVGDADPRSLYEKPVGWINIAPLGRAGDAHASLRIVLGYLHANLVEGVIAAIPIGKVHRDDSGAIVDPGVREQLLACLTALVDAVQS